MASRDLLDTFTPPALLVVQLVASITVLAAIALAEHPRHAVRRAGVPALAKGAAAGALEPGLAMAVGLVGLSLTTAGSATVISATDPLLTVLLAWLLLRQRPSPRLLAVVAMGVAGLAVVTGGPLLSGTPPFGQHQLAGDLLVLMSTALAAGYAIASSRAASLFPPATLALAQQGVALFVAALILASATLTGLEHQDWSTVSPRALAAAALVGVVQYGAAFWLYLRGLRHVEPGTAAVYLTLIPVVGVAGAWLWLGEIPTPATVLGALVIVTSLLLVRPSPDVTPDGGSADTPPRPLVTESSTPAQT